MNGDHPARIASQRSMDACHAKDKQAWIDNFADDAVIEDPIGKSPLDPEGKGHRGKEAIARFWDNQIAPNRVLFDIRESYAAGNEVANVGRITVVMPNGAVMIVSGVFTYRVNDAGKLAAMRAYWELAGMKAFAPGD